MRRRKFAKTLLSASLVFIFTIQWLPAAPPAWAEEPGVTPLLTPEVPGGPPPQEISEADREPQQAPVVLDGIPTDSIADLHQLDLGESPEQFLDEEASLKPRFGGPNFDSYRVDGTGLRVTEVYTGDVNFENASGQWVRFIPPALASIPAGWESRANGIGVRFPTQAGAGSAVRFEKDEVVLDSTLASLDPAQGQRQAGTELVEYPGIAPSTNLILEATVDGYKESVILESAAAGATFSWDLHITGGVLEMGGLGEIVIKGSDDVAVAEMPPPLSWDSAVPTRQESAGTWSLEDLGGGDYRIETTLDTAFLASVTYPVTLDPSVGAYGNSAERNSETDVYVRQGSGATFNNGRLKVGLQNGDSSKEERTFLKFDLGSIPGNNKAVYDATLQMAQDGTACATDNLQVNRVDGGWNGGGISWANQPGVGVPTSDNSWEVTNQGVTFSLFDVTDIYQQYVDTNLNVNNNGLRIARATGSQECSFYSQNAGGSPVLYLYTNTLPHAPTLDATPVPSDNKVISTPSPTLHIKSGASNWPTDRGGESNEVFVRFQVTDDPDCAGEGADTPSCEWRASWRAVGEANDGDGYDVAYSSPWLDKGTTTFTIPSGVLTDGANYWWRAQSADKCPNSQGLEVCPEQDTANDKHLYSATGTTNFHVQLPRYGTNPDWPMWSSSLDNGMSLAVNESTGNLYLDLPLGTLASPGDDIAVGLSYNSQMNEGMGLTHDWELGIGPASQGRKMPVRLEKIGNSDNADSDGVEIHFRDGSSRYFGKQDKRVFGATGADEGVVTAATKDSGNNDDFYKFRDGRQGYYVFSKAGRLTQARPRWIDGSGNGSARALSYTYDSNNKLEKVTDSLGRIVNVIWDADRIDKVLLKDSQSPSVTPITYDFTVSANGAGASDDTLDSVLLPGNELVSFTYVGGAMTEVDDGVESASPDLVGWTIGYTAEVAPQPDGTNRNVKRVTSLIPPHDATIGAPPAWEFDYDGNPQGQYYGDSVYNTHVTDPRGTATSGGGDYQTHLQLNSAGLPIVIQAPYDGYNYAARTWKAWDTNNNQICQRDAAANAISTPADYATWAASCTSGAMNTVWAYEAESPFRLKKTTYPDPGNSTGAAIDLREVVRTEYDTGAEFNGIWAEYYRSALMGGIPAEERLDGLNQNNEFRFTNRPAPLDGAGDSWAVRWSGVFDSQSSKRYRFKIQHSDGVSLSIGGATPIDCTDSYTDWQASQNPVWNCGDGPNAYFTKTLSGNPRPISIEWSTTRGNPFFELYIDDDGDNQADDWRLMKRQDFRAELGLKTRETLSKLVSGNENDRRITTTAYGDGSGTFMARALPQDVADYNVSGGGTGNQSRPVRVSYDPYGQTDLTTGNYGLGQGLPRKIRTRWHNDYSEQGACLKDTTAEVLGTDDASAGQGAVTDFDCDWLGRTTKMTATIRAAGGQGSQTRETQTSYWPSGRVQSAKTVAGTDVLSEAQTSYYADGNIQEQKIRQDQDTWAVTSYDYYYTSAGPATKVHLPDADLSDQADGPTVIKQYDWVGNLIAETDPRSQDQGGEALAYDWYKENIYDAQNRLITTAYVHDQADVAESKTIVSYQLAKKVKGGAWVYVNTIDTQSAVGPNHLVNLDTLGRTIREQTGSLPATETTYDVEGNVTKTESQVGSDTIATTKTYNAFNQPVTTTSPSGGVTENCYDDAGRLVMVDGPRGANTNNCTNPDLDSISFQMNKAGNIRQAQYEQVYVPVSYQNLADSGTRAKVTADYNDAGERLQVSSTLTANANFVRNWTYDNAGRIQSVSNDRGTSTYAYNMAGHVTSVELPAGITYGAADSPLYSYGFSFDDAGRQIERFVRTTGQAIDATETTSYDAAGRVVSVSNGDSTVASVYDEMGRLTEVSGAGAGLDYTTTLDYQGSRLIHIADAVGAESYQTDYVYNGNGQIQTVADPFTATRTGTFGEPGYDAFTGARTTYGYTNGRLTGRNDPVMDWSLSYESGTGRADVLSITKGGNPVASFDYGYDDASNIDELTQTIKRPDGTNNPDSGAWAYVYDGAGRLTQATQGGTERFAYAYDGAGNRTKVVQGGQTVTTTYDSTGLPENSTDGLSYTFDAIGQMRTVASASDQSKRRAYGNDAYGRLVRAVMGSTDLSASPAEGITRIDYGIDALGRTASRTQAEVVSGSTVTTTTDSAFRGTSEDYVSQAVGGQTTAYAYSPAGPLAQKVGNAPPAFYAKNLHGDVVGLVSSAGVAGSQSYSPYGESRNQIGDKASIGFQGDPTDPKTGLVDMTTRNYDPSMGRFVTQDILLGDINSPMSMNQYLYGNGSPITFSDPTGMWGWPSICWSCIWGGVTDAGKSAAGFAWGGAKAAVTLGVRGTMTMVALPVVAYQDAVNIKTSIQKRGVFDTVNDYNPVYQVPHRLGRAYDEYKRGRPFQGGEQMFEATMAAEAVVGIAAGATALSRGLSARIGAPGVSQASGGAMRYPSGNGFLGKPTSKTLAPGTEFERFGIVKGRYAAPPGSDPSSLSLPPGTDLSMVTRFRVLKPMPVQEGPAAPWFDQPGGGTQYLFNERIDWYLGEGYIEVIQ